MSESTSPITSLDPTTLRPDRLALFLDFDGTLAPIVDHPDAVAVPVPTMNALAQLSRHVPVAILSGRAIRDLDRFLSPLQLPAAGVHGLERRSADGMLHTVPIAEEALDAVRDELTEFAMLNPGLILESKPGSVALHYRQRPDLAEACAVRVERATAPFREWLSVLPGKMVLDIKAGRASKGDALHAFMLEPPFAGRIPFFAGDDVTDETAFEAIRPLGGITVKIGPGETSARFRFAGPEPFADWLAELAENFRTTASQGE